MTIYERQQGDVWIFSTSIHDYTRDWKGTYFSGTWSEFAWFLRCASRQNPQFKFVYFRG